MSKGQHNNQWESWQLTVDGLRGRDAGGEVLDGEEQVLTGARSNRALDRVRTSATVTRQTKKHEGTRKKERMACRNWNEGKRQSQLTHVIEEGVHE